MLTILIGHSYFLRFDGKQFARAEPYPPLATLQVAALLRAAGHRVVLFDAMLAEGVHEFTRRLRETDPQLVLLYEDNFNYLSKMCLGRMRQAACEMIGFARDRDARVIVGGSDASDVPEPYLAAGADVVLTGEGLPTLMALVERLERSVRAPPAELTAGLGGLVIREHGRIRPVNGAGPSAVSEPLPPAWDLVDVKRYRDVWMKAHGYFSLNMAASRGCSFRCNWCAKPIWGNRYLQRPAGEVAAELDWLKRNLKPDHIWFADDIFGFKTSWVEAFAAAVRAADALTPFTIQTRADLISEPMAAALRHAGCEKAWIGAESGSQRILDAMNKGTTVAEILTARERLGRQGIRVGFFIQLGYLGEELQDILATRRLIETAAPDDIGVSVSYPLPGTRFYEQVRKQLGEKNRWNDSGELAMLFHGAYRTEFYRAVRNLLHEQVSIAGPTNRNDADRRAAHAALQQRWAALLAEEAGYRRNATDVAAMA